MTSAASPFRMEIPAPPVVRPFVNAAVEHLLGLRRLGAVYDALPRAAETPDWIDAALAELRVTWETDPGDTTRIPARGPLVVVANHPFGAVEGLVLLRLLRTVRPDVRVLANRLLARIPELRGSLVAVDVYGGGAGANRRELREAIRWVRDGGALALFPAGEVSHLHLRDGVCDPEWNPCVAAFVRRGGADVVPVRFEGSNGPLFHAAGLLHPRLRTALLPRELVNKADRRIRLRVGAPIPNARLVQIPDDADLTSYLRTRTDILARRAAGTTPPAGPAGAPVPPRDDSAAIRAEVARAAADRTLATHGTLRVVRVLAHEAPALLREVGRCREIAFRDAGEGTGRPRDVDRFDLHYEHLVLWDDATSAVAGGYRLAAADDVLRTHGPDGLYTTTLFRLGPEFFSRLGPAWELGRSFVLPSWQRSFAPLMLLWKAIGACVAADPARRTLFGPVSISRRYAPFARQLMIEWFRHRAPATDLAGHAAPRDPPVASGRDARAVRSAVRRLADVDDLSEAVADIEPTLRGVPVLLREYHRLSGRFAAFSRDRAFGDVVDGLVVIDLTTTAPKILSRYLGKEGAARFLAYHSRPCRESCP